MLIEFRVRNFRSFKDEQVLSLVASTDKSLQEDNTTATGITAAPRVVRSAVLYGPNAGGKSNLIKALSFVRKMVRLSAGFQAGQPIPFSPFLLGEDHGTQPGAFEVTFLVEGIRYQYGFELTAQRITAEYLLVYKHPKPQTWFRRTLDPQTGQDRFEFTDKLRGPKDTWREATKPNSLFLSTAVQLNSEQLRPAFGWFAETLIVHDLTPAMFRSRTTAEMLKHPEGKRQICDFLNTADISIADIFVTERKVMLESTAQNALTGQLERKAVEHDLQHIQFLHTTQSGTAVLRLDEESSGTQRLFLLTGPVLDILAKGQTLVVDELDTSLHPLLVRHLVRLFHSPRSNPKGAQLLFSTHDSSLLNQAVFRRDQIWFVEKGPEQLSKLYPLTEFSPRKNEALEAGYLAGRYGALPFFRDWPE